MMINQQKAQRRDRNTQPTADQARHYQAYVLRCWAETVGEAVDITAEEVTTWRFSLEVIPGGERIGFAELTALLRYLDERTENKS